MATNLTVKQEKFCQTYIETGNASEAYRQAYSAGKTSEAAIAVEACKLLKHPKVALRIANLREAIQQRHEVTVDTLVMELEEARDVAKKSATASAMVAATMGKGKLLGLIVDRAEVAGKNGAPLFPERIEIEIVRSGFKNSGS